MYLKMIYFIVNFFHTGLKYVQDNQVEIKWAVEEVIKDAIKEQHSNGMRKVGGLV